MSQRGQRVLLWLLLAAILIFLLLMARPFASAFFVAAMLATVTHPVYSRLSRRLGRPGLASFLTTIATVILLGTILVFVSIRVAKDAANAYAALNERSLADGGWPGMIARTTDQMVDALSTRLPVAKETIRTQLNDSMNAGARYLASKTRAAVESMTSIMLTIVLATLFLYYLLRYGDRWLAQVAALIPLNPATTANLLQALQQSIVANMNGVLVVALAQGSFLSLGFWWLGIGSPLLLGMLGAIASVVPFVGATLVWVPVMIGMLLMGSYWKALALGLWGGLVVGSLDNILRPWIVGAGAKQHPVLIGFAMLGGGYTLGPLGLLIGPVVVALAGAVVEEIRRLGPLTGAESLSASDSETGGTAATT